MTLDKEDIYDIAKAVVKVIEDKDMMKSEENDCISEKVELQTLNAGDTFKVAGYKWIVLNQFKWSQTCFCITKDFLLHTRQFDEYANKWERSGLRKSLSSMKAEIEEWFNFDGSLLYMERDLMALDGTNANQTVADKISLLTLDEYRLYREYLEYPETDNKLAEWALLTPTTDQETKGICGVYSDGSIASSCTCSGYFNIRPVCTFKSNILVEKVES